MLSTSNLQENAGQTFQPKTFSPGNHVLKINSVELQKGYSEGEYRVQLNMEGPDLGEDFEGFFIDADAKSGERYKGQVGKVSMSQYSYSSKTLPSGIKIDRDQSILRQLQNLAKVTGVQAELDAIEADTIEEYVPLASEVLSKGLFANFCIAGKEYRNKGGYIAYNMFLPAAKDKKYAFTAENEDPAKLLTFDENHHVIKLQEAKAAEVDSFEADKSTQFTM